MDYTEQMTKAPTMKCAVKIFTVIATIAPADDGNSFVVEIWGLENLRSLINKDLPY